MPSKFRCAPTSAGVRQGWVRLNEESRHVPHVRCLRLARLDLHLLLSATPLAARAQDATPMAGAVPEGVEVVASGMANPRGFTWGADGTMFVGLAGRGGDTPGPEGSPFYRGPTAGVAAIRDGEVSMLATGLALAVWRDQESEIRLRDFPCAGDTLTEPCDHGASTPMVDSRVLDICRGRRGALKRRWFRDSSRIAREVAPLAPDLSTSRVRGSPDRSPWDWDSDL
jgi:hypothetical protein